MPECRGRKQLLSEGGPQAAAGGSLARRPAAAPDPLPRAAPVQTAAAAQHERPASHPECSGCDAGPASIR
eukprot:11201160-Lingulodinium_polyedra.AAC.1